MESFKIDILNPIAKKLLQNLADLKLIKIKKPGSASKDFLQTVNRIRENIDTTLPLKEITNEVEAIRSKRYGN